MRNLDIGDVAAQCGVPASTLRYYEQKGLITSIGRRGLRRVFAAGVLERLALIALGRSAGFSHLRARSARDLPLKRAGFGGERPLAPQRSGLPAAITAKLTGLCDLWLLARVLQCGF